MITVLIESIKPGGAPNKFGTVLVRLVAGPEGGAVEGAVISELTPVHLDRDGLGSIPLDPVDEISPPGSYYRLTVKGSSPTVTRTIAPTTATSSPVAWTAPSIQVVEAPIGAEYVPSPTGAPDGYTLVIEDEQYVLAQAATGGGTVVQVMAGAGVVVDSTDPARPVVSTLGISFEQVVASPTTGVTVNHNLGRYPSTVIRTVPGDEVEADITHVSPNQLTVAFGTNFTGTITCN